MKILYPLAFGFGLLAPACAPAQSASQKNSDTLRYCIQVKTDMDTTQEILSECSDTAEKVLECSMGVEEFLILKNSQQLESCKEASTGDRTQRNKCLSEIGITKSEIDREKRDLCSGSLEADVACLRKKIKKMGIPCQ